MIKLTELYKQREQLHQKQELLEEWMDYFDEIKLHALADQIEDDLDRLIHLRYVVQTQINKLEVAK